MKQDWILDVLFDLRSFARANGMPALAAQLDDATFVAQAELALLAEGNTFGLRGTHAAPGRPDRAVGIG